MELLILLNLLLNDLFIFRDCFYGLFWHAAWDRRKKMHSIFKVFWIKISMKGIRVAIKIIIKIYFFILYQKGSEIYLSVAESTSHKKAEVEEIFGSHLLT